MELLAVTFLAPFIVFFGLSFLLLGYWSKFQKMEKKWSIAIRSIISILPAYFLGMAFNTLLFMMM